MDRGDTGVMSLVWFVVVLGREAAHELPFGSSVGVIWACLHTLLQELMVEEGSKCKKWAKRRLHPGGVWDLVTELSL